MRSEAASGVLRDILLNIELAEEFVAGKNFDTFRDDTRTLYVVIRCLEIISEASQRLSEEVKARHSAIPWKNIAGAGNIYRHDYDQLALRQLRDAVSRELAEHS